MPEYLAPAVYVEEVDTGSKPIEGVSTSTAGMIGATERGPVNVPILITSVGEYRRWFGEYLDPDLFTEGRSFLPHAIEGFFTNGGKRVYVSRILDAGSANPSNRSLVAPDTVAPVSTQLLTSAAAGAGELTVADGSGLASGQTIQVGVGTGAEFRNINGALTNANVLPLERPLSFGHAAAANDVSLRNVADNNTAGQTHQSPLVGDTVVGAQDITLQNVAAFVPPLTAGELLRIGAANVDDEYVVVRTLPALPGENKVGLLSALQLPHPDGADVHRQQVTVPGASVDRTILVDAAPGSVALTVDAIAGLGAGAFVVIDAANANLIEYRRIGSLSRLMLGQPSYADYAAGTRVQLVTLGALLPGPYDLTADADIGATVVNVSNRTLMANGGVIQIGMAGDAEYAEIAPLSANLPGDNPGAVVLRSALRKRHDAATGIVFFSVGQSVTYSTALAVDSHENDGSLIVASPGPIAANDIIRISAPDGASTYEVVTVPPIAITPQVVPLGDTLTLPQAAGAAVVTRTPIIEVRAIDAGGWGDRLRVGMEVQPQPLLTTRVRQRISATSLRLNSASNVETGTELVITDAAAVETIVKVHSIDRQNDFLITLEGTTPLPAAAAVGDAVRSREYRFIVELMRQPDPANPLRNHIAVDREVFAAVSLDPRHSRYFERIVGSTWDLTNSAVTEDDLAQPLRKSDRRSEGESQYIRVHDLAPGNGLRSPPVAEYEVRPDGTRKLILLPLAHGSDSLAALVDAIYIGNDNVDAERRTGLFTLNNIEEISIVAAPGRTTTAMQASLINHCELARYRFAVLDGPPPPTDAMANVQEQRQQFDTKYAALYHPWLVIADPFPATPSAFIGLAIPPSGHVLGIYARTDIERGVHKAPANEVVRGIAGLQRILNKEQHDILNPFPRNINVIRDFRSNNRGIRVFGGRCITSDSDWKYVNVRRLLIFIEASIDRGLQWVVFEPNAEPLWARVRRSITNFLTLIWRNGALEGTKPEEAFFVKCDRTTMTQTDIDQGRLICLVGVAPVKPAEFVIVRIGLWTAHADD